CRRKHLECKSHRADGSFLEILQAAPTASKAIPQRSIQAIRFGGTGLRLFTLITIPLLLVIALASFVRAMAFGILEYITHPTLTPRPLIMSAAFRISVRCMVTLTA